MNRRGRVHREPCSEGIHHHTGRWDELFEGSVAELSNAAAWRAQPSLNQFSGKQASHSASPTMGYRYIGPYPG